MKSKFFSIVLLLAFTIPVFAQEADMSLIPYRKGDLWGYASPENKIVIKPEYNEANLFYEGYASVKKGKLFGYIDKTGKVVIPFKFYIAKPFRFGYFPVSGNAKPQEGDLNSQKTVLFAGASLKPNGYEICINTKGLTMPKCPAINENSVPDVNKQSVITIESNYSTIAKTELFDKIVGDYKMAGVADVTYYIAIRNNKYGVFNNKFDVIIPFEFSMIKKMNNSMNSMVYLLAEKNGMKGVLFGNGSPYVAVDNNNLLHVNANNGKDYFIISKDGRSYLKNTNYEEVVHANYTDIIYDTTGGFILIGQDNLKGFYFLNNNIVEPKYTDVKLVKGKEYLMIRTKSGKTGYVNNNGVEFFTD